MQFSVTVEKKNATKKIRIKAKSDKRNKPRRGKVREIS
jgi:hypothetical protein